MEGKSTLKLLLPLGLSLALAVWLIRLLLMAEAGALAPPHLADQSGTITILVVAAVPGSAAVTAPGRTNLTFDFSGDLGNFTLDPNMPREFPDLTPGPYTITENLSPPWTLTAILCDNGINLTIPDPPQVTIDLGPGEAVACTFANFLAVDLPVDYYSFLPVIFK